MPLSKARDRERKRLVRLESDKFQPNIPLYDPSTHRAGAVVRIQKGKRELTIPQVDADGNPIPEY